MNVNMSQSDIGAEVRRGARALDEISPGWYKHIDLARLNVFNDHDCILGQLCQYESHNLFDGNFQRWLLAHNKDVAWAVEHGFMPIPRNFFHQLPLTDQWRYVIVNRRINDMAQKLVEMGVPQPAEDMREPVLV